MSLACNQLPVAVRVGPGAKPNFSKPSGQRGLQPRARWQARGIVKYGMFSYGIR